ncbi:MAG: hypothetical protein HFE77_00555 [Clostridiales bacterium]|nr:hypothetical protein [Clostridiales bacterium]
MQKRITLFAGHYGSGKTNIAVNYALRLAGDGRAVTIADLDIVNPYFRTKDSMDRLAKAGVHLISSAYANTNVDVPALPQEMYAVTEDKNRYAVVDVGGDDRGALALGRITPYILEENNYEMLFVANRSRPLTSDAASALAVMKEIEEACGIRFTGLVNNTNLGPLTTPKTVTASLPWIEEISRESGLPVVMTTAEASICPMLSGQIEPIMPLVLQHKFWSESI